MHSATPEFGRDIDLTEVLFCAKILIAKATSNRASFNQLRGIGAQRCSNLQPKSRRTLLNNRRERAEQWNFQMRKKNRSKK